MKKINLSCAINGTGYGITSLNILKALRNLNINISLFSLGQGISCNNETREIKAIKDSLYNAKLFDNDSPCLRIWHPYHLDHRVGKGHFYVFPFFETDKLPENEIRQINFSDGIFTATKWSKEVLLNSGVKIPIYICPIGVDTNIFEYRPRIQFDNKPYIFFHIGKWEKRKSQEFLINAFDKAFSQTDNVELHLLPSLSHLMPNERKEALTWLNNHKLNSKIKIFDRLETQFEVAEFITNGDCGVFLSRAEGWNNEIPESMALNKPIIATDYSAHTEYCNIDNCLLVEIDELEPAVDGKWFNGFGNWAKLGEKQLEQTIEYMRFVYKNNIRTNIAGLETAAKYSWENTASIIDQTLENNKSYNATT